MEILKACNLSMINIESKISSKLLNYSLIFVIFSGIGIALFTFINNRSLWLDEAMLAYNITQKSYSELLLPLNDNQVAPIGFLFIEKIIIDQFGYTDLVLRIFPFISYLCTLLLLFLVCKQLVRSKLFALTATSMFSLNFMSIYYASEVKQYSIDAFICILILYSSLKYFEKFTKKRLILYILIGVISIWFSNIAVIILFTTGLYMLFINYQRSRTKDSILLISLWLISFVTYYILFISNHTAKNYMLTYWSEYFVPNNLFSVKFYLFILKSAVILSTNLFTLTYISVLYGAITIIGIAILYKTKKIKILYFLLSPILIHFTLSFFKLYPFSDRLLIYTTPLTIILFTYTIFKLWIYINNKIFTISPFLILIIVATFYIPTVLRLPIQVEETKSCFNYLNQHIEKNDEIYIYHLSYYSYKFYQNEFSNINKLKVTKGNYYKGNPNAYIQEILNINTEITWLLFSHDYEIKNFKQTEENYIIENLKKSKRVEFIETKKYKGASIYKVKNLIY